MSDYILFEHKRGKSELFKNGLSVDGTLRMVAVYFIAIVCRLMSILLYIYFMQWTPI